MHVQGIGWVGIKTQEFNAMVHFFKQGLDLELEDEDPGLAVFRLPSGALVDIFGPPTAGGEEWDALSNHFTTGPVPGFWVHDVAEARTELEAAGADLLGPIHTWGAYQSQHFRAPDGNVFEVFTDPKFQLPGSKRRG